MEAGADAYVVKSEFDHEWLVAKLRELLGRE
jgi:DNA-binding response OmpR family regulator